MARMIARRRRTIRSRPHADRAAGADTVGVAREVALQDGASSPRPTGPARRPADSAGGSNLRDRFPTRRRTAVLPWLALRALALAALAVDLRAGPPPPPAHPAARLQ